MVADDGSDVLMVVVAPTGRSISTGTSELSLLLDPSKRAPCMYL